MKNKSPWVMLIWLLIIQLSVAFVGRSIGPLAPFIEEEFRLSKTMVGFLPAALFLGTTLTSIYAGWSADLWGTRKMLLVLTIILAVFFFIVSIVPSFIVILLCILLAGLGYGAMQPTSNRSIIYWFPANRTGTAMGIKQFGVTMGSALSALSLVPLAIYVNWRFAIGVSAIIVLIIGIVTYLFYQNAPSEENSKNSLKFRKTVIELIHHKPLILVSIAAIGLTAAQSSLTTYIIFYISDSLLYPLVTASMFLALSEISGSAGRLAWGIISDRFFKGERIAVLILISIITACCSTITAFLVPKISLWILFPLIAVFGFCVSGFNGMWMNYSAEATPRKFSGVASGFSLSIGSLGVIFGPPLFGLIVDITDSFKLAWLFLSIEMVSVILILYWAQRVIKKSKPDYGNEKFIGIDSHHFSRGGK